MLLKTDIPHSRRSLRLRHYDYRRAGAYFVTICIQDHECLLGEVVDGRADLNDAGRMVEEVWTNLPTHYSNIELDRSIVMPNHIHGIIVIADSEDTMQAHSENTGQARRPAPTKSLSDIIYGFKSYTTKLYGEGVRSKNWRQYSGRLWQRNYYEHIVRNDEEMSRIREYISNNPLKWDLDKENPRNLK